MVLNMLEYGRAKGYRIVSDPIEMCRIDAFETEDKSEYVTELQIQVEYGAVSCQK
jgi:effector-binding domain-containing protein